MSILLLHRFVYFSLTYCQEYIEIIIILTPEKLYYPVQERCQRVNVPLWYLHDLGAFD